MMSEEVRALNGRFSGAVIEVSRLTGNGWTDMTGVAPDGEYIRYGSTWIERTEAADGKEYRIQVSLSCTLDHWNDDGTWHFGDTAYVLRAHKGEVLRYAAFRLVHVWVFDPAAMSYKQIEGKLPDGLFDRLQTEIAASVVQPTKSFADDLVFQAEAIEDVPEGFTAGSVDCRFIQVASIAEKSLESGDVESAGRLLVPFVRAVLTDADPEGRACAMRILSSDVLRRIVKWGLQTDLPEAAFAALRLAVQKDLLKDFPASELLPLVVAFVDNALPTAVGEDLDDFAALFLFLEKKAGELQCSRDIRLWCLLAHCHVDFVRAEKVTVERLDALKDLLDEYLSAYDEEHAKEFGEKPYLKTLAVGIKAPLAWQAFLTTVLQTPDKALRSFPTPCFSNVVRSRYRPPHEAIEGLSLMDLWGGLVDGADDLEKFIRDLKVEKPEWKPVESTVEWSWLAGRNDIDSYQLLINDRPEENELGALAVEGTCEDGRDGKTKTVLATFPFLPSNFAGNKPNVVVRFWRFFTWDRAEAADAELTTADGKRFFATMPYFVADWKVFARGARLNALLVGFADSLKKIESQKLPDPITVTEGPLVEEKGEPVTVGFGEHFFDRFDQDILPEEISRSGFSMQGRVKSVRELAAYGRRVLAVEIECERLEFPLRVYIAADKVKGLLAVGDTVESFGWLYVDGFDLIDKPDDYIRKYPDRAPDFPEYDEWTSDVPSYVRTEYDEEEFKVLPRSVLEPKWIDYGRNRLLEVDGVSRVVVCKPNPLHVEYLIRIGDRVEKVAFVIAKNDEKPRMDYPGTKTLFLHLISEKRGYRLEWDDSRIK